MTAADYDEQVVELIADHGWAIQGVFPTEQSAAAGDLTVPFLYTVGASLWFPVGAAQPDPELVVFGLDARVGAPLLNDLVRQHQRGQRLLAPNRRYRDVIEGYEVALVDVADEHIDTYLLTTLRILRRLGAPRPRVLQLVWPDARGVLPWEAGFDEAFRDVPLLGSYA